MKTGTLGQSEEAREANPLVPLSQFAPGSRTPASKSIAVDVTPSRATSQRS